MGVTSEDTKLLSAARVEFDVFGSDTYVVTFYPAENSDKQAERLLALARRGAEVEGATEAWMVLPADNHFGAVFPTRIQADQAQIRGPLDTLRRVLILRAEP